MRPRQNDHSSDDIFKWISMNENIWISIKISLKFIPMGPINNIPQFVQIMAWRRPGDKPLSETMMVSVLADICVTRSQWGKLPSQLLSYRCAFSWNLSALLFYMDRSWYQHGWNHQFQTDYKLEHSHALKTGVEQKLLNTFWATTYHAKHFIGRFYITRCTNCSQTHVQ